MERTTNGEGEEPCCSQGAARGRYLPMTVVLALAGSLSRARVHAPSPATMPTSGPTFAVLLTLSL